MTKEDFQSFRQEYGFQKYADIVSNGKHAFFDSCHTNWSGYGYVYLWVEEDEFNVSVAYIGKAGRTMKNRCDQHLAGFKGGSTVGGNHSARILAGIKKRKRYCVFARKSSSKTILGEQNISMCCVEEIALIGKLKPLWNSNRT